MNSEKWLPIEGYVGLYEVSTAGRVRSLPRTIKRPIGSYLKGEMVRKPVAGKTGYLQVRLVNEAGTFKAHYIHALVLEAFVGPRPEGFDACHEDGDRSNNRISNLRWDSRAGNHADKKRHGTGTVGEKHPMAKLTDAQVRALRIRRAEGESVSVLAAEFNVSRMTAHRAAVCKSWSHIQ